MMFLKGLKKGRYILSFPYFHFVRTNALNNMILIKGEIY